MDPIELLALFFALMLFIKIALAIFKPKCLVKSGESLIKISFGLQFVFLAIAVLSGYYVFQKFNIIEVGAIMFFTMMVMGMSFMAYWEIMMVARKKALKDRSKMWLSIIIWGALSLWILYALFM